LKEPDENAPRGNKGRKKLLVLGLLLLVVVVASTQFRDQLSLDYLATKESQLSQFQTDHPVLVYGAAFLVYVTITGLSLPGAVIMSPLYGWYFGLWQSVVLVSFASTAGATVAFLLSRYLLRDGIDQKFGKRLQVFNQSLDKEGPFYLFTLRLIPAMPFFVINVVMGLTRIGTWTFWWVSQLGMLAGTFVYCYVGSRVPDLQTLADEGAQAVFSPRQLLQITSAFVLLGVFPLAVKFAMKKFRKA